MCDIKYKPSMTYREARRYASNGLLRVDPDDLLVLLEMAEEHGAEEALNNQEMAFEEAYEMGLRDGSQLCSECETDMGLG